MDVTTIAKIIRNVVEYFDWLGSNFTNATDRRERIVAAGHAVHQHEKGLSNAMIHGVNGQPGLTSMQKIIS